MRDYGQKCAKVDVLLKGQPQWQMGRNVVKVSAALTLFHQVARRNQFSNDALRSAFGDIQRCCDITQANAWVSGNQ
jgi:hypothetical protein